MQHLIFFFFFFDKSDYTVKRSRFRSMTYLPLDQLKPDDSTKAQIHNIIFDVMHIICSKQQLSSERKVKCRVSN